MSAEHPTVPKARALNIRVIFGSTSMNAEIILFKFKIHPLVIPILKVHRILGLQSFS